MIIVLILNVLVKNKSLLLQNNFNLKDLVSRIQWEKILKELEKFGIFSLNRDLQ